MVMCIDIIFAILVRLVLLIHSLIVVWLATSMTKSNEYWLLALADIGLLVEGIVTIVVNKGKEWKWFCPCFFFYLCGTVPGIWVLKLQRADTYHDKKSAVNETAIFQGLQDLNIQGVGVSIPIALEMDTWVVIMEQLFLYLMILGRWILPRGVITRDELSQLLFVFIGIASDITELFALFEVDKVRDSTPLTYAILVVWTVSLLQFTFVLTATHSPKRTRVALQAPLNPVVGYTEADFDEVVVEEEEEGCLARLFQTEVWSICINFMLQDGPYLSVRMYTMIGLQVLTYSIVFFTAKNSLLVLLLIYRLIVVCCSKGGKKKKEEERSASVSQSICSRDKLNQIAMSRNESKTSLNHNMVASKRVASNSSIARATEDQTRPPPPTYRNGSKPGIGSRQSSAESKNSHGEPKKLIYNVPL